jgi:DNA polymerase-1
MNIPRYELEGWEADDLIGTIAAQDTAAGWETVIVTGDKDSLQLITDTARVKLVTTRMGQTASKDMTPEAFRGDYGFDPIHMIDLKALMGDASDNIPGVSGIGEKTAMDLVQRYHSVEAIWTAARWTPSPACSKSWTRAGIRPKCLTTWPPFGVPPLWTSTRSRPADSR